MRSLPAAAANCRSWCSEWKIAAKALRPLPNLHTELSEETRVRQRYLDLISREAARATVRARAATVSSLRTTFTEHGYLEVETPMLQTMHGGASARPFVTHSNAFDTELYLRIAPELFLKRAVVGGIERVYEINRNFRNEGADSTHSPEFAMLEAYQAYGDYHQMADLTREMVQNAALAVSGSHVVTWADGTEYDLGGDWNWLSMYESLSEASGIPITAQTPAEELQKIADGLGLEVHLPTHGKLVEELWEHFVKPSLVRPDLRRRLPRRHLPAGAGAPQHSRRGGEVGSCTSAASSWPPDTPSWSTPSCSASGSSSRPSSPRRVTPRRCGWTRSSCGRWSTGCRRAAAWGWASTAC